MRGIFSLPASVWLLGLVSLFNDAASELIYPLLPLYLTSVLMSGPKVLGLIEGVAEALSALSKLFFGAIGDRARSNKGLVVAGYALAGCARPLFALASSWPVVFLLRVVDRFSKGVRSAPRDALLASLVTSERRGLAFGLHHAMDNAGAVIGPLVAWRLLSRGMPIRDIFLWAIIPGVVTILFALFVKEPEKHEVTAHRKIDLSLNGLPQNFRRYLVVLALFMLGNSSNTFLLLRANELGVTQAHIPLLWGLVSGIAALFSVWLSGLSDRLGRFTLISAGWIVYGLFYLLLAFVPQGAGLWILFAVYGLYLAATEGAEKALVADLAPAERRGGAYGWFHLVSGIMLFPASLVCGVLYEKLGANVAFGFAAACSLTAAALLMQWVQGAAPNASKNLFQTAP